MFSGADPICISATQCLVLPQRPLMADTRRSPWISFLFPIRTAYCYRLTFAFFLGASLDSRVSRLRCSQPKNTCGRHPRPTSSCDPCDGRIDLALTWVEGAGTK